ncbi:bis(5'-nucleosyl)-tetraphosphatase (symmetrical) YqeK [Miniphocaeibacter halophilus]|uniref:Bis(5'-nucleosyl)-tetraphosphatase (Symmetrical) YqeK n=1 Tax=Miniphocaeibacter halophilus TaxID=2931922 RepID=A0AC61MNR0_9FIRM|nr:bis(5'-nucleosyl)-tetraphosphatase (symmetrical) YqeK [Miniphocaeibacter halophilus]QQK07162.1 bis(5'-nucleosyl)-tetraphosphatase (symmetrical) YqeK [Miniphocaeibacter halophilus]
MFSFEEIKENLKRDLKKSRYEHTLRVVNKAEEIAGKYKLDINKCKLAALLHDCGKGKEEHYKNKYISEYNKLIKKDEYVEFKNPFLEHCIIGYLVAKNHYKVEDNDVLNAILWHTTGRLGMTEIEKVIYLADKTENGRDYPSVDKIREKSLINLNDAIILSINNNIKYLIENNQIISINTIKLRNELIGGISGR